MAKKKKAKETFQFADPVEVVWEDCTGSGAWVSLHDEPIEPVKVHQLGFFLAKNGRTLHIAQGLPENDCQALGMTVIPTGCILSLKKVKL